MTKQLSPWTSFLLSLQHRNDYCVLESNLISQSDRLHYAFLAPEERIIATEPEGVDGAFARIADGVRGGLYAAGFFSYELGYCFESKFPPPGRHPFPLLHVGLYREPITFDAAAGAWIQESPELPSGDGITSPDFSVSEPILSETWPVYEAAIREIKHQIELGETYQINYTFRLHFRMNGNPLGLYLHLKEKQSVPYAGIWRHDDLSLLSLSPELFFRIDGGNIEARPMKGTAPRGGTPEEDARQQQFLHGDEKNRAENVMILDLLRNDLGRVSLPGTVHVPRMFDVETYETLHQMTSTVRATLRPDAGLREIFAGLFPCGSVTGAPKIRSMQLIRGLEGLPRGVYTGALGFIAPQRRSAVFNVAIRTLAVQNQDGEMGIGSGIVYDSQADSEWSESLLKGNFLLGSMESIGPRDFSLIETLLWSPQQGFFLVRLHLERLMYSADHFGFPCDINAIAQQLAAHVADLPPDTPPQRVRLLLHRDGSTMLEHRPVETDFSPSLPLCTVAPQTVLSTNPFLYHKTTVRDFYNAAHKAYYDMGFDDVIFMNERGEITEGAVTNIVAQIGDKLFTPRQSCGLLDGVFRRHLLEAGQIREKVIYPGDLFTASSVFLCNSVRGLFPVRLQIPDFLRGKVPVMPECGGGHD